MNPRTLTLLAGLLLAGAAHADPPDGPALYNGNCTRCHGADGKGLTFLGRMYHVRNFTDGHWQASLSDDDIYNTISNSPSRFSVMPAFKGRLSEDERRALVRVVRGFNAGSQ